MDDHSDHSGLKQRRSSRACQGCRTAKTKCETPTGEARCRRCVEFSTPCQFFASRRGRIKGSKNLRTLQRLSASQGREYHVGPAPGTIEDTVSRRSSTASALQDAEMRDRDLQTVGSPNETEDSATPWNPQASALDSDNEKAARSTALARNLLSALGDLPVANDRTEQDTSEVRSKGLQEPIWLIAGLAKRGWDINEGKEKQKRANPVPKVLSSNSLSTDESRYLRTWTTEAFEENAKEQSQYFKNGVYSSKCDVAPALDPIHQGLVTENKAQELFDMYWEVIQPQWPLLDPTLHALDSARQRSALLTTTILAVGATALALRQGNPESLVADAIRLHAHVERLTLVIFATGAKSIDIIQALILGCRWGTAPKTRLCENRWIRSAMIPRMATEIGLAIRCHFDITPNDESEIVQKLRQNDLRTRVFMIINEHRFTIFNGRHPIDLFQFQLTEKELDFISSGDDDTHASGSVLALYRLFLFDRDVRRRIDQIQDDSRTSFALDAESEHVKAYMEDWMREWAPRSGDPETKWYRIHDCLSCWLLLAVRIAKARLQSSHASGKPQQQNHGQQQLLLSIATRIFAEAAKVPNAVRVTNRAGIFAFAASIILRLGSRRDLVLRVALNMAGEAGEPHVSTFVREAGVQTLLMLHQSGMITTRPSSPPPEDSNHSASQEFTESMRTTEVQTTNSIPPSTSQIPQPCSARKDYSLEQGIQETTQNFQGFGESGLSHLPGSADDAFSFNVADIFPNLPDPRPPQDYSQNVMGSSYYPFHDLRLDELLGDPAPDAFSGAAAQSDIHDGNGIAQDPIARFPVPFSNFGYDPAPMSCQDPQQGSMQELGMSWPLSNLSPSDTIFGGTGSDVAGAEDRAAQRRFLLSAVDRLIQLASLI